MIPTGPIRTCIGCRRRRPQADLVRCVLDADGSVRVDRGGPGRGAWLCGPGCLEPALRRRAFDRAFRATVRATALDRLADELTEQTNERVGIDATHASLRETTQG